MTRTYRFVGTCVQSDGDSIRAMNDAAVPITYHTARKRLGPLLGELARSLGYDRHLPIWKDWHVAYAKSTYRGEPCVFVRWSRIEHIFVEQKESPILFCTSYCNRAHDLKDGKPVDHECHVLPTTALRAELDGRLDEANELLSSVGTMRPHRGKRHV